MNANCEINLISAVEETEKKRTVKNNRGKRNKTEKNTYIHLQKKRLEYLAINALERWHRDATSKNCRTKKKMCTYSA